MAGRVITYGGVDLSQFGTIESIDRDAMGAVSVASTPIPGRDGSLYLGATVQPLVVSAQLRIISGSKGAMRETVRGLAGALRPDGLKPLIVSDEPSRQWMAVVKSCAIANEWLGTCLVNISWACPDPCAWSVAQSGGAGGVDLVVGGTYPTRPVVTVTGASGDSNGLLNVMDDGGAVLGVHLGSLTGATVEFDCEARTAKVNGSLVPLTLSSDWWEWEPGTRRAELLAGTGTVAVTWNERWL